MGTRGFVGFVIDDREAIAYNHANSYPGGVGLDVLAWLNHANLDVAAKFAKNVRVVSSDTFPDEEDIERLERYLNRYVSRRDDGQITWYQLLRGTQGSVGEMIAAGVVEDASQFPRVDSVSCEWGYLVDFDAKRFEVYCGMQKQPHADGRFAGAGRDEDGFYPCRLVASWPLDERPDEDAFLAALNEDEADACPECGAELVPNNCTSGVCPSASCHNCGYGCDLFTDGAGKCVMALRAKLPHAGSGGES